MLIFTNIKWFMHTQRKNGTTNNSGVTAGYLLPLVFEGNKQKK